MQSLVEAGHLEGERGAYRLVAAGRGARVPATVQAVLAARIDRLAEREKAVLQTAAVIGKEFPEPVLSAVVELDASGARGGAARARRGRVRLRAGALSRGRLRLQASADAGGRLRLAARRAPRHGPRRGRARDRRALPRAARRARGAPGAPLGGRRRRRSRRRAGTRAPRPGPGTNDPTHSLSHWRQVRELTDTLPESAETAHSA